MFPESVTGSCLCGSVSFEIKAPWYVEPREIPKFAEYP